MMPELEYMFPVVYFYSDDYEDSEVEYLPGYITLLETNGTAYEATVIERGNTFHIIFGRCQEGWYLCIPSIEFGCVLSHPGDTYDNLYTMTRTNADLDYEDAVAITYGLAKVSDYINEP